MAKIALLPDLVVDQIAAGEVVENAASAVKELIENSLDAGASEIIVTILGGGLELISIEDDGCGMDREDALLCLKRHATSKIRWAEDLERLSTMGFRGEALAALASIAKLEIKTSLGGPGYHLSVEGGTCLKIEPLTRNRGTTVIAKSLFFNTPARLKFQKSASANAAAILKVVQTIAMAHPEIRFTLHSNGKTTLKCSQVDWKLRAKELMTGLEHDVKAPMIHGLVGNPEEGRGNRHGQMLFINRRPIVSPLIAKAVKEGFGTRMQEALFPTFLLFLELPPDWIDVNVHPQKKEVRFKDESAMFKLVRNAVFGAFGTVQESALPWEAPVFFEGPKYIPPPFMPPTFRFEDAPLVIEEKLTPLAILGDFLLVEALVGWQLVDLRGAEARIVFEEMNATAPLKQPLLWPLEYTSQDPEELVERLGSFHIEARVTSKHTIAIDATPQNLGSAEVLQFVQELSKEPRKMAAALTKTYRSIKRRFSLLEATLIWEKLGKCQDKTYDPLGKKIVSPVTQESLTRMFE